MNPILDMYPLAFWGLVAVGIIIIVIALIQWRYRRNQAKYRKDVKGKLLCEMLTPGKGIDFKLCDVHAGQVKSIEDTSRLGFVMDAWVKAPKGHDSSIDVYYVLNDHCWPVPYPFGEKSDKQVTIWMTHYVTGDPMPKITYRPQDWTPDRYAQASAAMTKMALNEKALQVLSSEVAGIWKKVEQFVEQLKTIPQVRLLQFVTIVLLVIIAILIFTVKSDIGDIKPYIVGG